MLILEASATKMIYHSLSKKPDSEQGGKLRIFSLLSGQKMVDMNVRPISRQC